MFMLKLIRIIFKDTIVLLRDLLRLEYRTRFHWSLYRNREPRAV